MNPNTIPFYRVFNYTPKEGNDMQRTKSEWYNYVPSSYKELHTLNTQNTHKMKSGMRALQKRHFGQK